MKVKFSDRQLGSGAFTGRQVEPHVSIPSGISKSSWQDIINRVEALEAAMTDTESDVSDITTDLTALQGRVTTAEGNISTLSPIVSEHTASISAMSTAMGAVEDDVDSLESRMTIAEDVTARVPDIETQLDSVSAGLDVATANITTVKKRIEMSVGSSYNLLQMGADGYEDGVTHTHKGVTYTVNSDGSVTANGTASGTSYFYFSKSIQLEYGKTYHVSGCPQGGATNTYRIRCDAAQSTGTYVQDTGNGALCTPSTEERALRRLMIIISSGTTVTNLVFRPMIVEGTEAMPYINPATAKDEDSRYDIQNLLEAMVDINTTLAVLDTIQADIAELQEGVITEIADGVIEVGGTSNDS